MRSNKFKFGFLFVLVCNFIFVIGFLLGILFLFQIIDAPNIIEKDHFINYMESIGCEVIDVKKDEKLLGINTYLSNKQNSCPYEFSYTVFSDNDELKRFFDDLKNKVLNENNNIIDIEKYNYSRNFIEYKSNGEKYNVVTLNQNSILYMSSDTENRGNVLNAFKYFNYESGIDQKGFCVLIISFGVLFLMTMVCFYFIEVKIRNDGFVALVPYYNIFCIVKDVFGSFWYILLFTVPILSIIFWYKLGRVFGKSYTYCLFMMLFPTIFAALLAFDDSYYTRPEKKKRLSLSNDENFKKENVLVKFFMRCLTIIFLIISFACLSIWFEENLLIYLILFIEFLIYGLFSSPFIIKHTKKYKSYTKSKPFLVVILIVLMFLAFLILPV